MYWLTRRQTSTSGCPCSRACSRTAAATRPSLSRLPRMCALRVNLKRLTRTPKRWRVRVAERESTRVAESGRVRYGILQQHEAAASGGWVARDSLARAPPPVPCRLHRKRFANDSAAEFPLWRRGRRAGWWDRGDPPQGQFGPDTPVPALGEGFDAGSPSPLPRIPSESAVPRRSRTTSACATGSTTSSTAAAPARTTVPRRPSRSARCTGRRSRSCR